MLQNSGVLGRVERIQVDLYGSLALTGRGHGTDRAVLLGLSGERPDTVDPEIVELLTARVKVRKLLHLNGHRDIPFHENADLLFHEDASLPRHPNGIRLSAFDAELCSMILLPLVKAVV